MKPSVLSLCFCSFIVSGTYGDAREPLPTFAGPAMGTTYRVTLKAPIQNKSLGDIHREIDQLLQQIDLSLSTWRDDSSVSRLNHAPAHTPVQLDRHLTAVFYIAQNLHRRTEGRFDITVAPLIQWWRHIDTTHGSPSTEAHLSAAPSEIMKLVGFSNLQVTTSSDSEYPHLQKAYAAVAIDLSGIGAGYAVDQIGNQLESLGSTAHLVELGGEVRAWGQPNPSENWQVALRSRKTKPPEIISLHHGQALAVSTSLRGKRVINPLTGRSAVVSPYATPVVVYAQTCAEADGLATAKVLNTVQDTATD